jgi:hypothetical protein
VTAIAVSNYPFLKFHTKEAVKTAKNSKSEARVSQNLASKP